MTARARVPVARAVRYGLAGLVATAVYFGVVAVLVERMGVRPVPAAAIGTVVVTVLSYVVNRAWVFHTNRGHVSAFARFVAATVLSMGINTGLMFLAVGVLGWSYVSGLVLATLVVPPTNFAINNLWSFRD
jgi:putative flippase GtrA